MTESFDELLLQSGLVTQPQLSAARADAARTRKRMPETLIDLGFVNERRFAQWAAQISRTRLIDPLPEVAAAKIQHKISKAIARDLDVVPVALQQNMLSVAMINPMDTNALSVLRATTGLNIQPMTGVRSAIARLVKRFYPEDYGAPDITLLPPQPNFDPVSDHDTLPPLTAAGSVEEPDFDFSDVTLITTASGVSLASKHAGPARPNSAEELRPAAGPDDSTSPTAPLIALQRRVEQLARMIAKMQKQLDEITAIVHR